MIDHFSGNGAPIDEDVHNAQTDQLNDPISEFGDIRINYEKIWKYAQEIAHIDKSDESVGITARIQGE